MNKYQNDIVPLYVATQTTSLTSCTLITYSVVFRGRIEAKNNVYTILIPLLCCSTSRANSADISYAIASACDEWKWMYGQFERRHRFLRQKGSHSTAYEVDVVQFSSPKSRKYKNCGPTDFPSSWNGWLASSTMSSTDARYGKNSTLSVFSEYVRLGRVDSISWLICCRLSPQHLMRKPIK